ncbi:hypothetical protein TOPH_02365 [Tolypocladium ophioglossoides CBS 100239]|uniref:Uncharacterized protein n=1 Tax=Tolypocladium ophioglossoides (strain CBS 100239) TaxID=1163406 RepID=A0A0L0NG50_TOLOC|nr:hypothetical protein TOPH_02365 [Tolypocladium ophioglossoides CBS 100239]
MDQADRHQATGQRGGKRRREDPAGSDGSGLGPGPRKRQRLPERGPSLPLPSPAADPGHRPVWAVLPPPPVYLSPGAALFLNQPRPDDDDDDEGDEAYEEAVLLAVFSYHSLAELAARETVTFAQLYAAFANQPPLLHREAFQRAPRRATAFVRAVLRRWPELLGETLEGSDMGRVVMDMRERLDGLVACGARAEQVPRLVETRDLNGNVESYMEV